MRNCKNHSDENKNLNINSIFCKQPLAQENDPYKLNAEKVCREKLNVFVDSLSRKILNDTIKFKTEDVILTSIGYRNFKDYSPLFIINNRYVYKLDIINATEVKEFTKEYFTPDKIENITFYDESVSSSLYGTLAKKGVILITLKKRMKFNPKVAGLTMKKRNQGDNYSRRKENSILIRD